MAARTSVSRTVLTCVVTAVVVFVPGVALFNDPKSVVRIPAPKLLNEGGYAPWKTGVIVLVLLALAIWVGVRRAPLAAAWTAAAATLAVSFTVTALRAGSDVDYAIAVGAVIGSMAAGLSFLGIAVVGTLTAIALDRRARRLKPT